MRIKAMFFILWIAAVSFPDLRIAGISPAIKIGYEFGERRGFVAGIGCGIFYFATYPPGPVASVNTATQFSFKTKTFSQSFDVSLGVLDFLIGSVGGEFHYGKGFFTNVTPFYQLSLCAFDIEGITYRKYIGHDEYAFYLRAGYPVVLYSEGSLINLNLRID